MLTEHSAPDHLFFLHVQKTAGSTFHNILARQYPAPSIVNIFNPVTEGDSIEKLSVEQRKNIRLVKGHFPFGMHEKFSGTSEYITILRDPVERTISHFYFVFEYPEHPLHKEFVKNKYSLLHVLEKGLMRNLDNNMVRMISGENKIEFGACTDQVLDSADQHLEIHFPVIGLQDEFDFFLLHCSERYHWKKKLWYTKQKVGKKRPAANALDKKTIDAVKAYNRLDEKLFSKWSAKIKEENRAAGKPFAQEVEEFRKKNARMNKLFGWLPDALR